MIMRLRSFFSLAITLFLSNYLLLSCSGIKSAFSHLQKQQYRKADEQLHQAVEKDTLPVAAYYGYSLLYSDTGYASYNIDTAYQYAQQALATYPQLSEKRQTKLLRRLELDTTRLQQQKLRIDSLAYARAKLQDNLSAYQRFLANFATAPRVPTAIVRRNELAYDSIQQVDTYPAYKYFMDTYPEAAQYPLAQERYNTLAFQGLTQEGDLASYLRFLETYPNSPYRPQAERAIYEISTADGQLQNFARFARQYPRSAPARAAVNTLFHLYRTAYPAGNFLQNFPGLPYADSLRRAISTENRALAPTLDASGFGLIDPQGKPLSKVSYDFLPNAYLCEGVITDFVHAARINDQQLQHDILTKDGTPILSFTEPYSAADSLELRIDETVIDREAGLLAVTIDGEFQVVHQGGHAVIAPHERIAEIELMPSDETTNEPWPVPYQFIKFRVDGQWGLKAFSGRTLLEPAYTSIEAYGPLVVLEQNGRYAVTNRAQIVENVGSPLTLRFRYDDVAALGDDFLLGYQENQEAVIDDQLNEVVPLKPHQVVRRFRYDSLSTNYWLLKHVDSVRQLIDDTLRTAARTTYSVYEPERPSSDTVRYQRAFYNDRWLALKRKRFWLVDNGRREVFDSVQILGDHFVLTVPEASAKNDSNDSVVVRLANGRQRRFARRADGGIPLFRLLRTKGIVPTKQLREFLWIEPGSGPTMIINTRGETVTEQPITGATVYPRGLIVTERGRQQGLIDSLGNELLPARYEGIGNYEAPGVLSLLDEKKFGLFLYPSGIILEPVYESALTRYSQTDSAAQWRFVAKHNGRYGIVTASNERLTPFAFERVVYWNDSSALVKADGRWLIYQLATTPQWSSLEPGRVLYDNITDFSFFQQGNDLSEQLLRIYAQQAYGVLSSRRGEVLAPTYDGISLFGDPDANDYLYLTEKYVPEADLYILIYLNAAGKLVKRQALTAEQYDRLYCE